MEKGFGPKIFGSNLFLSDKKARGEALFPLGGTSCRPANSGLGAGEENRTLVSTLEKSCSTIELHPHLN